MREMYKKTSLISRKGEGEMVDLLIGWLSE
jgi:hypothetical protein